MEFSVDIKLKSDSELRLRVLPTSDTRLELMLVGGGNAEFLGAPLGPDIRYRVAPSLARVAVFSWTGCLLRLFTTDAAALEKMEPCVAAGGAWHSGVMEVHAQLHEARQRAMRHGACAGPVLVIGGGGPATGRHQLATTLANLCSRSTMACTVVDCDPLHQSCGGGVPLTIGATAWEHTKLIDDSSTPHFVSLSLATGRPTNADASQLSHAYVGAVTKLVKTVRQRLDANLTNRVGWSGAIVVLPALASASLAASLLFRVCETTLLRADRVLLLGAGSSKSVLARLQAEYVANFGAATAAPVVRNGSSVFTRQLRGATSTVEVSCMAACPSSLVTSDAVRSHLQEDALRIMLNGNGDAGAAAAAAAGGGANNNGVPLQQLLRHVPLSAIDIAVLKNADSSAASSPSTTAEVASRVSAEQLKVEGEGRLVAFYASLHDCSNFAQPTGYGVLDSVDLAKKEVVVRTGKATLPGLDALQQQQQPQQQGAAAAALVIVPGVRTQL